MAPPAETHPADLDERDLFGPSNRAYACTPVDSPFRLPAASAPPPPAQHGQGQPQARGGAPPPTAAQAAAAHAAPGRSGARRRVGGGTAANDGPVSFEAAQHAGSLDAARRARMANLKRKREAEQAGQKGPDPPPQELPQQPAAQAPHQQPHADDQQQGAPPGGEQQPGGRPDRPRPDDGAYASAYANAYSAGASVEKKKAIAAYAPAAPTGPVAPAPPVEEAVPEHARQPAHPQQMPPQVAHTQPPQQHPQQPQPAARSAHDPSAAAGLPSGWLECPKYGEPIQCGPFVRIVPCKVPLDSMRFAGSIPSGCEHSPEGLVAEQRGLGRRVDAIIDLTNTTRYYDRIAVQQRASLHCIKVPCKGRGAAPEPRAVNEFFEHIFKYTEILGMEHTAAMQAQEVEWQMAVRKWEEVQRSAEQAGTVSAAARPEQPKPPPPPVGHVLVHCTHGFNRTGYMIVNTVLRMSTNTKVSDVVRAFARARSPGIYKPEYIDELYRTLHERRSASLLCPPVPQWKPASPGRDGAEEDHKPPDPPARPMEHDDIIGEQVPMETERRMQAASCTLLGLEPSPRFPGSQPVSLDSQNKRKLEEKPYTVTWKADGTRYMVLLFSHGTYLIDRAFNVRRVDMRWPRVRSKRFPKGGVHDGTLLDGEMVVDVDPKTQARHRRFYIYDIMALHGQSVVGLPFFSRRWRLIEDEVVGPRNKERAQGAGCPHDYEAEGKALFAVRRKHFWPVSKSRWVLEEMVKGLGHECDGVILQPRDDAYAPHTFYDLLKWKYSSMNSVDFKLKRSPRGAYSLHVQATGRDAGKYGGELEPAVEGATVRFGDGLDPESFVGQIIECALDPNKENEWVFMRARVDKDTPNAASTFERVMRSIRDGIEEEDFLRYVDALPATA